MVEKKDNKYYVNKIINDIIFILNNTNGLSKKEIEINPLLIDSIMFRLIQISENTDHLTEGFKKVNGYIPWKSIKGMRNLIVHDYGVIDLSIIFDTITNSLPEYYKQLLKLI